MKIGFPAQADDSLYYTRYLKLAGGEDLLLELGNISRLTLSVINKLTDQDLSFQYAAGKWSIGILLKHICDAERVYAYRALRMLRGDATNLPGFDEDVFASRSTSYPKIAAFTREYQAIRAASIELFLNSDLTYLDFEGKANGLIFTPRILGWLMIGHNHHHIEMLKERYLPLLK